MGRPVKPTFRGSSCRRGLPGGGGPQEGLALDSGGGVVFRAEGPSRCVGEPHSPFHVVCLCSHSILTPSPTPNVLKPKQTEARTRFKLQRLPSDSVYLPTFASFQDPPRPVSSSDFALGYEGRGWRGGQRPIPSKSGKGGRKGWGCSKVRRSWRALKKCPGTPPPRGSLEWTRARLPGFLGRTLPRRCPRLARPLAATPARRRLRPSRPWGGPVVRSSLGPAGSSPR